MSTVPAPRHSQVAFAAVASLTVFSAAALGADLGRGLVTTYLPVLLDDIRDAPGLIGTVMLVNTVAGFFVPLGIGLWSDRLHARGRSRTGPFILGGSLLAAGGLGAIALGYASTYLFLALAASIAYIGLNAVTTAHRALIPETFGDSRRAVATGAEELAMWAGRCLASSRAASCSTSDSGRRSCSARAHCRCSPSRRISACAGGSAPEHA